MATIDSINPRYLAWSKLYPDAKLYEYPLFIRKMINLFALKHPDMVIDLDYKVISGCGEPDYAIINHEEFTKFIESQ